LHQICDLFELNVKLRCQKFNHTQPISSATVWQPISQPYKRGKILSLCFF